MILIMSIHVIILLKYKLRIKKKNKTIKLAKKHFQSWSRKRGVVKIVRDQHFGVVLLVAWQQLDDVACNMGR